MLDAPQHAALHDLNAATRLTRTLDEAEALAAQRAALEDPSAAILTLAEVGARLGIDVAVVVEWRHARPRRHARARGGGRAQRGAAARARARRLAERAGARRRPRRADAPPQIQALFRRLGHRARRRSPRCAPKRCPTPRSASSPSTRPTSTPAASASASPTPSSSTAARAGRRSTSSASRSRWCAPNAGVPTRAACTSAAPSARRPRCAPRSSLRRRWPRSRSRRARDATLVATLMRQPKSTGAGNSDSGVALARVRRDAKNALEQRAKATACGEEPRAAYRRWAARSEAVGRVVRKSGAAAQAAPSAVSSPTCASAPRL